MVLCEACVCVYIKLPLLHLSPRRITASLSLSKPIFGVSSKDGDPRPITPGPVRVHVNDVIKSLTV